MNSYNDAYDLLGWWSKRRTAGSQRMGYGIHGKPAGGEKWIMGLLLFFFIYIFNDGYELAKDTPPKYGLRNMGYGSGLFSKGDLIM